MNQTKAMHCDCVPTQRNFEPSTSPEPIHQIQAKSEVEEPTTAVEAVRYLFLANELHRLGQSHAAERWRAKAMAWLAHLPETREA